MTLTHGPRWQRHKAWGRLASGREARRGVEPASWAVGKEGAGRGKNERKRSRPTQEKGTGMDSQQRK